MKLTDKQKQAIIDEFNSFKDKMYASKSKEERETLGQFFTPADLTIQVLEQLDCTYEEFLDSDVIDPTSGSGNLLAAALIIGADPQRVFGNEYDATMVKACRERLKTINPKVRDWQIHQGNALIPDCLTEFSPEYDNTILKELLKRRNGLKGGWLANPECYVAKGEVYQPGLFEDFFGGN